MKNYQFNLAVRRCLGLYLTLLISANFYAQSQNKLKNIVLVMADDFNFWNEIDPEPYYDQVKTPKLKELATRGVLFSVAQSAAPVCNPSRMAMWSGFRPSTTGIEGNQDGHIRTVQGFENIVTLNQYFKDNGYTVHGAGKLYHEGFKDEANFTSYSQLGKGCEGGVIDKFQSTKDAEMNWSVNPDTMTPENCLDHALAIETAAYITAYNTPEKPFFVACGFARPHLGWDSPNQFYKLWKTEDLKLPKGFKDKDLDDTAEKSTDTWQDIRDRDLWKQAIHMYISCLALSDHNAGLIFDAVEKSEKYKDNTIVVFIGDHGWHLGEKEKFGKATPWENGNKTTMIVYDPTYKNSGDNPRICRKAVSLQDIYPTLVELSGLPIKTDIEGNSIAALIENPSKTDWDKPLIVSRGFDRVRTNRFSYAINRKFPKNNMLYDLDNDQYEFDNLLNDFQTKMPAQEVLKIKQRLDFQFDSIKNIGLALKQKLLDKYVFDPNLNKPLKIPGRIEVENYDEGGPQQTYNDSDTFNTGNTYRKKDAVDIYASSAVGNGFYVGDLAAAEWMNYTVKDYLPGNYTVDLRAQNTGVTEATVEIYNRDKLLTVIKIPVSNRWIDVKSPKFKLDDQYSTRLKVKIKGAAAGLLLDRMDFTGESLSNPDITANISRNCLINTVVSDNILKLDLISSDVITTIEIYEINGQLVSKSNLAGERLVEYKPKTKLNPGVYLLRVVDDSVSSVEKFIVK